MTEAPSKISQVSPKIDVYVGATVHWCGGEGKIGERHVIWRYPASPIYTSFKHDSTDAPIDECGRAQLLVVLTLSA